MIITGQIDPTPSFYLMSRGPTDSHLRLVSLNISVKSARRRQPKFTLTDGLLQRRHIELLLHDPPGWSNLKMPKLEPPWSAPNHPLDVDSHLWGLERRLVLKCDNPQKPVRST